MQFAAWLLTVIGLAGIAYNVAVGGYAWNPSIWGTLTPPNRSSAFVTTFLARLDTYVGETVGLFGYSDLWAPPWMVTLWFMLIGAVTIPGLLRASRRHALAIVGVIVVAIGLTFYFDLKYLQLLSWSQYARYFLPFAVGAWLMSSVLTPDNAVSPREEQRLPTLIVIASAPAQLWALAMTMSRYQAIGQSVNPFRGTWTPIWGFYAPAVMMAAGLVALIWLCFADGSSGSSGSGDSSNSGSLLQAAVSSNSQQPLSAI